MNAKHVSTFIGLLWILLALLAPRATLADEGDPPSRVARLGYLEGSVSFQPAGTEDWVAAPVNRPLTTGDKLWSDRDGRVELQLDGSLLRLSGSTAVSFLNLGDDVTQVQLTTGTLLVHVRRLDDNETYEIDTPNLAFSILRPGVYRLTVDESGSTTAIWVRNGQGEVTGGGAAYSMHANEYDVFSGMDPLSEIAQANAPNEDQFDAWSADRDERWERSASASYVSPDVVGYEDLDDQGSWRATPDYGYVWYPQAVEAGWAPYHYGHWAYIAPWGYTWVDDQPWGFAPFHYGRWIWEGGAWGWVPCRPRTAGVAYVRPVYAPALVAWVGVGAGIAWFALGPREVFVPSYPVSRRYVTNINVSNTTVNTTVINNVYNTTIVNNNVNVTNVAYVNRNVPGAVAATTSQAFTTAQPVRKNFVKVDPRAITGAPVRAVAPDAVPTKQAVLGSTRATRVTPPAAVQARPVVARISPPPPAPPFERRQEAIRNNAGKPLSVTQVRELQSSVASHAAAVRIAPLAIPAAAIPPARPPASSSVPSENRGVARPAVASPEPARPAVVNAVPARPAPVAVHPNDFPAAPRPASPSVANSALERQHLQEQQQLRAQQELERQRIQQQQELEHAQLAKQQADAARRQQQEQELERQHQLQTEQLMQQHAREQQELQERQQEQQRQASKPPPKNPKGDHPK